MLSLQKIQGTIFECKNQKDLKKEKKNHLNIKFVEGEFSLIFEKEGWKMGFMI